MRKDPGTAIVQVEVDGKIIGKMKRKSLDKVAYPYFTIIKIKTNKLSKRSNKTVKVSSKSKNETNNTNNLIEKLKRNNIYLCYSKAPSAKTKNKNSYITSIRKKIK